MTDLVALQKKNDARWKVAKITRTGFDAVAKKGYVNKQRYIDIIHRLRKLGSNMPDEAWVFIAVVHNRESGMDFDTHLGQGDPLNKKTVHVPAGRGPFFGADAFEQGAVDALWYCAPHAAKNNKDWSISGMLTYLERYNGLGYANRDIPSPYLWAGTDQYTKGKYVADGVFDANAVDKQLGCSGLIKKIDFLDGGIDFGGVPDVSSQPVLPEPDKMPVDGVFDAIWLQWALNQLGATPALRVDGINGIGTKAAVKRFQQANKLTVDGIAGKNTIAAIINDLKELNKPIFPIPPAATPVQKTFIEAAVASLWELVFG